MVASLIVWTQIIGKSAVTFQSTPWGYWYTTHMSPFRVCQFILAISSTFIFYYIVLTKLRKNKLSRLREILKGYLWFAPIVFTGYFIDTFVPAFFKVPAVPASAVGAFFSTMLLFRLSD